MKQDPIKLVRPDRVADDLWQLVNIPSPTRRERNATLKYAELLAAAGADVELDESIPDSPSVIGRLKGNRPGKTFQLAGHIDHIDVPHPAPQRTAETISGRGSADMKNGLAGILEVVRVLKETGGDFPGQILVTVYGLHEAPLGDSKGLLQLIARRVRGDAALVTEGSAQPDLAIVAGKGQSIWNLTVRRAGEVCHELNRPPAADGLFAAVLLVAEKLRQQQRALEDQPHRHPLLGPESLFVGQMHYGDFYNRMPAVATFQGTRRWHPDHTFAAMQQELERWITEIRLPADVTVEPGWTFVGEAYAMDPGEAVVTALTGAYRSLTGHPMKPVGTSVVYDAHRLVPLGGVPTVMVGFDNEFAHADHEYVRIPRLGDATRLVLQTVLNYLQA